MSMGVPAGSLSSRGFGGAGIATADSDGWTGFVASSGTLADCAARLEQRKTIVNGTDIELLMRLNLLTKYWLHEQGNRSAARAAGEKGYRCQTKNAWQSRHALNGRRVSVL